MICMVCGREFERDDYCPVCSYPVTLFTDASEAATREEQQRAEAYRKKLFDETTFSAVGYTYGVEDGRGKLLDEQSFPIGTLRELIDGPVWLSQKLTNFQGEAIPAEVTCTLFGTKKSLRCLLETASTEPELILGLKADQALRLHFLLKDSSGIAADREYDFLN